MLDTFDGEILARAKRVSALAGQAARLSRQLQKAAEAWDVHAVRQRIADAVTRAGETAAAVEALRQAVEGFGAMAPETATEVAATPGTMIDATYARGFERACATEGVALEGAYPDYRVFPFDVRIRLREERVFIGRKSWWALRPEAVARAVRRERDRLFGSSFAVERFGASLARAHALLLQEARERSGPSVQQVALRDVFELLRLGGRVSYTRDEFAFDLFRFRQTPMVADGWRVVLGDMRGVGSGFEVPNGRGGHERLAGLRLVPLEEAATNGR